VDVTLDVVHSDTLRVAWNPPLRDGGSLVDKYLVEWFTSEFREEEQSVTVTNTLEEEVQIITTSASDALPEIQVVRTLGGGGGSAGVSEQQTINCDADGGYLRIVFDGEMTEVIPFDASAEELVTAFEDLSVVTEVAVNIIGTQSTLCGPDKSNVRVTFKDVANWYGDVPQMQTLTSTLEGTRFAEVTTTRPGNRDLRGEFVLSFNGDETEPIPDDASGSLFQSEL